MVFGMSTACFFPNAYTEQAVSIMGEMHVEYIEVFFSCLSEYRKPFVKELNKIICDNGIRVYSVHALSTQFEPQLFSAQQRAREEAQGLFRQVLDAGAKLGAQAYVFHGPLNIKHARKLTLNYQHIAQIAGNLADTASEYGIKLAWENVHWCWYSKPDFAAEILKFLGSENLYFTLDIKQAAQSGYEAVDFLKNTCGRLVNIHVCDYNFSEEKGIYPALPFKGIMDFIAFKEALIETGYDKAMILEVYKDSYSDYNELSDNFQRVVSFFSK